MRYCVAIFVKQASNVVSRMTITTLDACHVQAPASASPSNPPARHRDPNAQACTSWKSKQRYLEFEAEAKSYLLDRFGSVFAEWMHTVFLGRFKCIDPAALKAQEIGLWGCRIDACNLRDSTQKPELEKHIVDYTQDYMGSSFADFLNQIFRGDIQQGFVDSRTGFITILTKPVYFLEKIDNETVAYFAMLPFTQEDLNHPGVRLPKGSTIASGRSRAVTCSHKQCADCGEIMTTNTCLECKLSLCRMCRIPCIVCRMPLCTFCHEIYRHKCLPQKLPPTM